MEIKADGWHHIAVTKVGSDITVYDRALSTGEVTKHYEKAVLAESPVAYWRLGDRAHPDWKFGDVLESNGGVIYDGKVMFITNESDGTPRVIAISGPVAGRSSRISARDWQLVAEPDD
jgi:hypothetical protein